MSELISALRGLQETLTGLTSENASTEAMVHKLTGTSQFETFLAAALDASVYDKGFGEAFEKAEAVEAITPARMLRSSLNLTLAQFFRSLHLVLSTLTKEADAGPSKILADRVIQDEDLAQTKMRDFITGKCAEKETRIRFETLVERAAEDDPHTVYPTSPYRVCDGHVHTSKNERTVETVMSVSTFSSIKVVDDVLNTEDETLRDIYAPLGRCVCFIDSNVETHYGERLSLYFQRHGIILEKMVYRALEADKGIATVERMLADLKRVGIARHEPVLLVGGGVLADTGGLACALYGRNTPYVMLSTSIVTGIDAGPSPRTCCDGFGYKNLLGAYHPPVVSLTDRSFFKTLHPGWVRHGIAEIIKMAVVKNAVLFDDLEQSLGRLLETQFGTINCEPDDPIHELANKILAGALKSYVESEFDNLYETHQCRPHAYGHTWSPGFEIVAGLLHGHAVSIGMGFGAYLSLANSWITETDFKRILDLMEDYGLSLWHDVLDDESVMIESHRKIIQKRGGNLVAPIPKDGIGTCGYLNDLSEKELLTALAAYRDICAGRKRAGIGIDPLCSDVGLEAPDVVGTEKAQSPRLETALA